MVTILPTTVYQDEITFHFPKTVPGTYSLDNYGKYIEAVKAFDTKGKELTLEATLYRKIPLQQNTAEGGQIDVRYSLKPINISLNN